MTNLKMTYRVLEDLEANSNNARTHSKKQIKQLERSIKEYGFVNPVLIDRNDHIVAGHGRVEAARNLGLAEVPTICLPHLTEIQIRALLIADNKLAENAGWNLDLLTAELKELSFTLDYDTTLIGFESPDLDLMLKLNLPKSSKIDQTPSVDTSRPAVSRRGDLWRIGEHLVLCGDATERASYERLLGNEPAGLVFTDPPYNVSVAGHIGGRGKVTHSEFAMASGEMTEAEFAGFLKTVLRNLADFSRNGSLHYLCMDWRHMFEILTAGRETYAELKNLCVWAKTNGGMGSLYRSQHELVFVYKNGTDPHINNVELGKHGRNRTNVWSYGGANGFSQTRDSDLAIHPTVKPVQLVADAILDASNLGDVVLDAFGGSGSTLLAAEQTGRRGRAIEIEPYYVDTIVRRLQAQLKIEATRVGTSETFATTADWRGSGLDD